MIALPAFGLAERLEVGASTISGIPRKPTSIRAKKLAAMVFRYAPVSKLPRIDIRAAFMIMYFWGAIRSENSATRPLKDRQDSTLKVYPGQPHRMSSTHKGQINEDLLAFCKG